VLKWYSQLCKEFEMLLDTDPDVEKMAGAEPENSCKISKLK